MPVPSRPVSAPSPLLQRAGSVACRRWRTTTWVWCISSKGTIGRRWTPSGAPWPRWRARSSTSAQARTSCPPCSLVPFCAVLAEGGAFAEGRAVGEAGMRIAEAVNHPLSLMYAYRGVGQLALRQGNLYQALPLLERAAGICEDTELPFHFSLLAQALGAAYVLCGRVDEAMRLLERVLEQTTVSGRMNVQAQLLSTLGEAQLRAGHLEEAHALATRALSMPVPPRDEAIRRLSCASSARLRRIVPPWKSKKPQPTTRRPSRWPRNWACARSRRTATGAWARCMPQPASGSRPAPSSRRPSTMYSAMEMTFWLPRDGGGTGAGGHTMTMGRTSGHTV